MELKAFPNPFHDNFTLSVPSQNNNSRVQVMIYDITVKMVYSNEFGNLYSGVNSLKGDNKQQFSSWHLHSSCKKC